MFTRLTTMMLILASTTIRSGAAQRPDAARLTGPLRLHVTYPVSGSAIGAGDSIFVFGTSGDSRAVISVAGQPAHVAANGAWIAWVAVPRDSAAVLFVRGRAGNDTASIRLAVVRSGWTRETGAWVDRASLSPTGSVALPRDEPLALTVRAAPDAGVRLTLADGTVIHFAADSVAPSVPAGIEEFDHDDRNRVRRPGGDRYVGVLTATSGPVAARLDLSPALHAAPAGTLEIIRGGVTTRVAWPLAVTRAAAPVSVVLDDDPRRRGGTDRVTIGRATPGGTYTWFFPAGTRARAEARINDQVRLRLADDAIAWVPISDLHLAAFAEDFRPAVMGSLTMVRDSGTVRLRIPLTRPVPVSVDEDLQSMTVTLYGAVSNANFTRYGAGQDFVDRLTWRQEAADRVVLSIHFSRPLWGWRHRYDGNDLVVDVREPPTRDATRPLAGRLIVVDPGHPPEGACGPTGLCEPEANLAVARIVRDQLVAGGARVILTRAGDVAVDLWPRVALADSLGADLLVSIHANALPDGVNPFTNNGTSTFFNHPQSLALARAVQARLVARLGLRDLGVARADFALVRPTWYPVILTEGLDLMIPEQESLLRSPVGQRRYAGGIVEGITAFLRNATLPRTLRRK